MKPDCVWYNTIRFGEGTSNIHVHVHVHIHIHIHTQDVYLRFQASHPHFCDSNPYCPFNKTANLGSLTALV
jgi:hypothetical protein